MYIVRNVRVVRVVAFVVAFVVAGMRGDSESMRCHVLRRGGRSRRGVESGFCAWRSVQMLSDQRLGLLLQASSATRLDSRGNGFCFLLHPRVTVARRIRRQAGH